jgi:hypothetical protein
MFMLVQGRLHRNARGLGLYGDGTHAQRTPERRLR